MFEELLLSVVLIILCIISNLYSKKEEEKETIKNNDTDWMNIFKKKEKINELNRLLIDELIEDIVVSENGNIKARKTMRNKRMLRVRRKKYDRGERYVQKIIHRMAEASGFYGS